MDKPTASGSEPEVAADLVRRVKAGDADAETELYCRYRHGLMLVLRRKTRNPELAEDITQETFRIILERLRGEGLEQPEKLAAFIRRVAVNLALKAFRREVVQKTDANSDGLDAIASEQEEIEDGAIHAEEAGIVHQALDELKTSRDKEILLRFYIDEEDKASICEAFNLSDAHFYRVLFRARQRFKALLEAQDRKDKLHIVR
ncbi:MAG: sigma-70 family RNA polymerase sigma factor [Gammaproteobacteria bacterium]|nr:sigma-70 family RNA polymerase sigma factor [Gammaproteobacteria bacterium]